MEIPEVWDLDPDQPYWLESILRRLLAVGVPPTALSKAFNLDVTPIRELEATMHIEQYGTAEISEAMNFLIWRAFADGMDILDNAPSASRQRFITTLLSRQSSIVGKQSPEALARMRAELDSLYGHIGVADPQSGSIYATSPFTPTDGDTDDPEEGPES